MNHTQQAQQVNHELHLTSEELRQAVNKFLSDPKVRKKVGIREIPDGATAHFTVPSGGDYSGETLSVDEGGGVTFSWIADS